MSNWDGRGTPTNGQMFRNSVRQDDHVFIGISTDFAWVGQCQNGSLWISDPKYCKPIKTPEEVERQRSIDEIKDELGVSGTLANRILDAGYRKIKPLSFEQYQKIEMIGHYKTTYRALVEDGYIIEKKDKS